MEPPWKVGKKVYIKGTGHLTKMGAMLIYGKKLSKIFYGTKSRMTMKHCVEQYVLKLYKVYINDDRELTLTHFKTMSELAKLVFVLTVDPDTRGFTIQWQHTHSLTHKGIRNPCFIRNDRSGLDILNGA